MGREELEARIEQVHRPYHRALGLMLEWLRDRWGAALLVDLHSMPPLKANRPSELPPQFVIGDRFGASCEGMLAASSLRYLAQRNWRAAHNRPYAGGYVLDRHGAPSRNIHALQLEICRSTYLDADFDRLSAEVGDIVQVVSGLVQELAGNVAGMGGQAAPAQAAE